MSPARLDRVPETRTHYSNIHSLTMMSPYKFYMIMILVMVALVVLLVVLSQTTGFMQMDVYNNGAWR